MAQIVESIQDELGRRHRAAQMAVAAMFALTLLLMLLAVAGVFSSTLDSNQLVANVLRIAIAIFVLGAITLRRTKFSVMRLRDIAALRGISGLLETLQKTTTYVALIGGAIAVMGFVVWLMSGDERDKWLGVIAIAVL